MFHVSIIYTIFLKALKWKWSLRCRSHKWWTWHSTSQPAVCAYVCVLTYSKCFFRCTGSSLHKLGHLRHPQVPPCTLTDIGGWWCGVWRQRGSLLSDGCDVSPHPSKRLIPPSLLPFLTQTVLLWGGRAVLQHIAQSQCAVHKWMAFISGTSGAPPGSNATHHLPLSTCTVIVDVVRVCVCRLATRWR